MLHNKTIQKWIMTIALSLVSSVCLISLSILFHDITYCEKNISMLKKEEKRLTDELHNLKKKKHRIEEWLSTEKKIHAAHVDADHWLVYPLNINQVMAQNNIMEFLKKINSGSRFPIQDQLYWLLPHNITIEQPANLQDGESVGDELLNFDFTGQLIVYLNDSDNPKRQTPR
jgi:hypothetical protein